MVLRRRAGEVDLDLVACDRHRGMDLELALARLEDVGGLVAPVGERRDRRADASLRVGVELVHSGRHARVATPVAELGDPALGEAVRGELGTEVAEALVRVSHARDEGGEDLGVEAGGRNDDALLVERRRVGGKASRLLAPDVGVVGARHREPELGARDERDVGEVRAARVRVVQNVDVVARGVPRRHRCDRVGHRAEVDGDVLGLRDHPPVGREERRRAVAPLLDVRREGGADEHGAHLLCNRPQRAADDLELDFHDRVTGA